MEKGQISKAAGITHLLKIGVNITKMLFFGNPCD